MTIMTRYLTRRILSIIPLLLVISAVTFVVGQYGAGDLAAYLAGARSVSGRISPEVYEAFRQELNLDTPILVRYVEWLGNALRGDFGKSYVLPGDPPIAHLLATAVPISLQLGLAALSIVTVVGVPLGILAAVFRNTPLDYGTVSVASVISTVPAFVLAPVAIIVVVIQLNLLPSVGIGWSGLFSEKTLLPALCLAAGALLNVVRFTRVSVLEVLSQEYIRAARARGLSQCQVIARHVVRNALTPVVTILGLTGAGLIANTIFIETIFNIQGFGWMASNALRLGDITTATACALVATVVVMTFSLVVDILYGLIDPRVNLN
jgi:ABC-type dipeptide/oligopeptide/nickel transport system permease component